MPQLTFAESGCQSAAQLWLLQLGLSAPTEASTYSVLPQPLTMTSPRLPIVRVSTVWAAIWAGVVVCRELVDVPQELITSMAVTIDTATPVRFAACLTVRVGAASGLLASRTRTTGTGSCLLMGRG